METWRRLFIVIGGFIEALIFSGCLFGWASLVYVLQQEGVYSHLCEVNSTLPAALQVTSGQFGPTSTSAAGGLVFNELNVSTTSAVELIDPDELLHGLNSRLNENLLFENSTVHSFGQVAARETVDDDDIEKLGKRIANPVIRCIEQDRRFGLIYTIAAVNYGCTSIIIGFCLDIFGLWATRISASAMTTGGFLCLAFTSKAIPWLLWPGLILISLGTIQLRQSSFQFANIYPKQRATILTLYGAAYSVSTILFLLVQYGHKAGIPYQINILFLAAVSLLTLPFTFLMPRKRIDDHTKEKFTKFNYDKNTGKLMAEEEETALNSENKDFNANSGSKKKLDGYGIKKDENVYEDKTNKMLRNSLTEEQLTLPKTPLPFQPSSPISKSLLTLSAFLHTYWQFMNFLIILFYSASFNAWAYKTTDDPNDIAFYNEISGLCQLIAPIFIPTAGCLTDILIRRATRHEDRVEKLAATLEAPAYSLVLSTLFVIGLLACKMFTTKAAIYVSLVLIAICRPLAVGCCTTYIRIRFPAEHFNRLFGIFTTIVSLLALVQYPLFVWMYSSPENFIKAHWLLMGLLIATLASPGHMLLRTLTRKYALAQLKYSKKSITG